MSFIKKGSLRFFAQILLLLFVAQPASSLTVSEKAKIKRGQTLDLMVFLEVPLKNFQTPELEKEYAEIKAKFRASLTYYYEVNYLESYRGFLETLVLLEKLYEKLSLQYIDRTNQMLQKAAQTIVSVEIEFHKRAIKNTLFDRDRLAPKEKQMYDPTEFHFTYTKRDISSNLEMGYNILTEAKEIRQMAMDVDKFLEEDKEMDPNTRLRRVEMYRAVINRCRQSKQNAVQAFRLINKHEVYKVQDQFKNNYYAKEYNLDPVFDPRIPDQYKVDASDSLNRLHSEEIRIKLNNENIVGQTPEIANPGGNKQNEAPAAAEEEPAPAAADPAPAG